MAAETTAPDTLDLAALTPALSALRAVEDELNTLLLDRAETVRLALLALLTRQHMVILGPPGTAKSRLIDLLAQCVAAPGGGGLARFVWLMTKHTTPEELFGPVSIAGLKADDYRRVTDGKLPEAQLAFLDEIWKSNSAILNGLLRLMNEREFHNGRTTMRVPLQSMFGASNEMPQGDDLGAVWDRFLVRAVVDYLPDAEFARLLALDADAAPRVAIAAADLAALQAAVAAIALPPAIIAVLVQLRRDLAGQGIVVGDRRFQQALKLLRANALLDGRAAVEEDDLAVLKDVFWMAPEQRKEIQRATGRIANPMNQRAVELGDMATSVYQTAQGRQNDKSLTDEQKMAGAVEALSKLKKIGDELRDLYRQAQTAGRSTQRIEREGARVKQMREEFSSLVLGA